MRAGLKGDDTTALAKLVHGIRMAGEKIDRVNRNQELLDTCNEHSFVLMTETKSVKSQTPPRPTEASIYNA